MKLIFVDHNPGVCVALQSVIPEAEVRCCKLSSVPNKHFDVIFTPGNSFGFMDGGFDLAVRDRFPEVEGKIQQTIKQFYYGALAIGQAFATYTDTKTVVYAPTMRVPEPIVGTDNVYWAFRAALMATRATIETKQIRNEWGAACTLDDVRVLSSAFGTSAGQVSVVSAAHAMRLAYEHVMRTPEQIEQAHTWRGAYDDHAKIRSLR
ncbi:hypothetical protein [Burkholderia phage FLC9]|nr:hypothetical protein [Burkholderia phage FLC9]